MKKRAISKADLTKDEGIGIFITTVISTLGNGLLVMLAFGLAHGSDRSVFPFGYWDCVFFSWVVSGLCNTSLVSIRQRLKNLGK